MQQQKNLGIEKGVADMLGSSHIPYHLLCKSHTCERLDSDVLSALTEMEHKIRLKDHILSQEPRLRSFTGGCKSFVEIALIALLNLVLKESDGKTVSLREQFDCALESNGLHKSLSLYKEKKFTKLGYWLVQCTTVCPILNKS